MGLVCDAMLAYRKTLGTASFCRTSPVRARRRNERCRSRCEPYMTDPHLHARASLRARKTHTAPPASLRAARSQPATDNQRPCPRARSPPPAKPPPRSAKRPSPSRRARSGRRQRRRRPRHERGRPQGALRLHQDRDGVRAVPRLGRALFGGGARGLEWSFISGLRALLLFFGG